MLDIMKIASFTDLFVICTGTSNRMLDALSDAVLRSVHQTFNIKGHQEGNASGGWLTIDFGDIVVHLFAPDKREFYRLEDLWRGGKILLHLQ